MLTKELNIKQKRVMTYFIAAAKELIDQEGVENLTVRKVALAAGYNSATLYNYFEDMEALVVFASVSYLSDYIEKLAKALEPKMDARQRYRKIYEVFSVACFERPEQFYNLFHGKYKKRLEKVISIYYDLFPDELGEHQGEVYEMLTKGDMEERDMAIMPSLIKEGFVAEKNVKQTVTLMIRMFQSYLFDVWMGFEEKTVAQRCEQVMETFDYIMDKANIE